MQTHYWWSLITEMFIYLLPVLQDTVYFTEWSLSMEVMKYIEWISRVLSLRGMRNINEFSTSNFFSVSRICWKYYFYFMPLPNVKCFDANPNQYKCFYCEMDIQPMYDNSIQEGCMQWSIVTPHPLSTPKSPNAQTITVCICCNNN